MRKMIAYACFAFCFAFCFSAAPAAAGVRTYIYVSGNDANACTSPSAPCATIQRGIDVAGVKGEVLCLNPSFFGTANISFSITIICTHDTWQTGVNQVVVTTAASDVVIIDGMEMNHRDSPISSGINFTGAGTLIVRNSKITSATTGIRFFPSGPATLIVEDLAITNCSFVGLHIQPQPGGYANAHVRNVKVNNSGFGIVADGQGSTSGINLNIQGSLSANNANQGLWAYTVPGAAPVNVNAKGLQISGNFGVGIRADGPTAVVRVGSSLISSNILGLVAASGGQILTHGDNQLDGNGSDGTFSGAIPLK